MAVETHRNRSSRFPDADRVQPAHDPPVADDERRRIVREVKPLHEPNSYVGDGATGDAKNLRGLLPGVEYRNGTERSSNSGDFALPHNDRRAPHSNKFTLPLMAVTHGRTANRRKSDKPGFRARFNQRSTVAHGLNFEISNFEPDIQCHRFAALESAVTLG